MCKYVTILLLILALMLTGCTPTTTDNTVVTDTSVVVSDESTAMHTTVEEGQTASGMSDTAQGNETSYAYPELPPPATPTPVVSGEDQHQSHPNAETSEPIPFIRPPTEEAYRFTFYAQTSQPPAPNNAGVPDDYITVEYNAGSLLICMEGRNIRCVGEPPITIEQFHYAFPIECLRQIDENTYYAVYKVQQGGYFYVHFQKMLQEPHFDDHYYDGCFALTGYDYITEKHTSADFTDVQEGDPFSKLEEIDTSMRLWSWYYGPGRGPCFRHILEDGMLYITASWNAQGEFIIDKKIFYEGGIEDIGQYEPDGLVINTSILPQDFPQ